MRLFCKTPTGETLVLEGVLDNETIRDIKRRVEQLKGIPFDNQRFIFSGLQLCDDRTLFDYNIQEDSTIHIVLIFRGD